MHNKQAKDKQLISEIESTFCELMDLTYYCSEIEKINISYDKTLEIYQPLEWSYQGDEFNMYNTVREALKDAKCSSIALVGIKTEELSLLIEKAILSADKTVFKYLFGRESFKIQNIKEFSKLLSFYISLVDDMHVNLIPNQKEKMIEIIREYTEEVFIHMMSEE